MQFASGLPQAMQIETQLRFKTAIMCRFFLYNVAQDLVSLAF